MIERTLILCLSSLVALLGFFLMFKGNYDLGFILTIISFLGLSWSYFLDKNSVISGDKEK